jgi:hypothetical protein
MGANGLYGTYTAQGGTGFTVSRDRLDAMRLGGGRTPSAEYPDGYLGTIRSRQDDRTMDSIKGRENQRSYQRGVHKGVAIDPADYEWPMGLDPQRGIRNMVRGIKTAPAMELAPAQKLVNDGKGSIRPSDGTSNQPGEINPARAAQMSRLLPNWS